MKGILLAGGSGSRMGPMAKSVSKHLMPVYSKPLIFYSLSALLITGCKEILIISSIRDETAYRALLGDGSSLGISIQYARQARPNGIAEALIIGETFIGNSDFCLCLGDNFLYGADLPFVLERAANLVRESGNAHIFCQYVNDPERFGVAEFQDDRVVAITEKPTTPKSKQAVIGLYMYPCSAVEIAKQIDPSHRGELEITSVNEIFLNGGRLEATRLGRGVAWIDSGTPKALSDISSFVRSVEEQQGVLISSPEEICWRKGYIDNDTFLKLIHEYSGSSYAEALKLAFENR